MTSRVHLIVTGRVQGVGFRYACQEIAEQLGVTGWVRNRWNGAVEIVAEGEEDAVTRMLDWCRQGPSGARVNRCDVTREPPTGEFKSFEITF